LINKRKENKSPYNTSREENFSLKEGKEIPPLTTWKEGKKNSFIFSVSGRKSKNIKEGKRLQKEKIWQLITEGGVVHLKKGRLAVEEMGGRESKTGGYDPNHPLKGRNLTI